MRLFIGIPLAADVVAELSTVISRLRRKDDGLRWSAAQSWHITLQFLGDTTPPQYRCLAAGLAEFRSPPVPIHLGELSFFDRSGVFVAGVQVTPQLLALQQLVTATTIPCGFIPETRPYHPHITLARAKAGRGLSELKSRIQRQPPFTRFTAGEFNLYESFLGAGGSRYEIRSSFSLSAP